MPDTAQPDFPRLIEHAFPLKQASLDSVHEKNVRHGHISTLHIWPARRPLAACRAALIATLLPDPSAQPKPEGMSDAQWEEEIRRRRKELCEKIGGRVVKRIEKKKMPNGQTVERVKEETEGGILHWGRETENAETLEWFRREIRKAYGGRAPKVLDPFAGGGAIPLEAMRLGCEATAVDINPVAWFILKCTLEYPQKLAGQTRPLPEFILHDDAFMAEFFKKAKGYSNAEISAALKRLHTSLKKKSRPHAKGAAKQQDDAGLPFGPPPGADGAESDELQADLAWHVRAWGQWVLDRARRELARYYPTYADFEPIKPGHIAYERQPMRLVPLKDDGTPDIDSLNAEFTKEYLEDKRNPRWVAKPTIAYLWARTVRCKNCRATVPLLKTRWLCKKANKRVLLTMEPNANRTGVVFGVQTNVPAQGGNAAQKREHDRRIGLGTMSKSGATCPCCGVINTKEDIQQQGLAGHLGFQPTGIIVNGLSGKEYRLPTTAENDAARVAGKAVDALYSEIPFGIPADPITVDAKGSTWCTLYGFRDFSSLFLPRQLLALGALVKHTRSVAGEMRQLGHISEWPEAVSAFLAVCVDRLADYNSSICHWHLREYVVDTFQRFGIPVSWDLCEINVASDFTGGYDGALDWVARYIEHANEAASHDSRVAVKKQSAIVAQDGGYDLVLTDPPYYNSISYAAIMDFFYVWLRRCSAGGSDELDDVFRSSTSEKWDHESQDGELIDDANRFGGDRQESKRAYEEGMAKAFVACRAALNDQGRLVIVFAHKHPDAWETLVSAIIRAGFVVDGSWPIQTEMGNRMRALGSAALASSVWLVCKKRPATARPGWDNNVLEEMKANIAIKLREFWDAGIRGPDFVWAATGPALEAYSKHPVVRKANEPNATMGVGEFLNHVRRMVVDFVVGRVLSGEDAQTPGRGDAAVGNLDEVTAYYLLHRHDFGMDEAPVGACILYATACGLSDAELERSWDILSRIGSDAPTRGRGDAEIEDDIEDEDGDGDAETEEDGGGSGGGSKVKLKAWNQRRGKSMGYEAPEGKAVPLIDRIHRVMHLWKDGDLHKVDEYIDEHGLRRNELFKRVVQSLIELSTNSERSLLESISNHIGAKGAVRDRGPELFEVRASE